MAGQQRLSDSELARIESQLGEKFDSIKAQVSQLQANIDGLEGAWRGIGAGAFNAKQVEVNEEMRRMGQMLTHFQEAIKATRTMTGNTDDEAAAAMRGVDVVGGHTGSAEGAHNSKLSAY
jgi:WXG100 family type VII secretion target